MITTRLKGGLGNQIFQYAVGKALAKNNNTKLALDLTALNHRLPGRQYVFRAYCLDIFQLEQNFTLLSKLSKYLNNFSFLSAKLCLKLRAALRPGSVKSEQNEFSFDENISNAKDGIILDGYWQHVKYFEAIKRELQNDLQFKNKIGEKAGELLEKIKGENSVCVHVRRGDYVNLAVNQSKFVSLSKEYFNEGIKIIESKVAEPKFYIFSDDLPWCNENLTFNSEHTFVGQEYEGEKLRDYFELMLSCKNFIISNSTFSWWAAWLSPNSGKVVIAPKFWLNDKSVDTGGLLLNEWIKI